MSLPGFVSWYRCGPEFKALVMLCKWPTGLPPASWDFQLLCNMSKTSASVSSGLPNTKKQMKAQGRRPSAFIVSRCLEPLMKHEARVFDVTSQSRPNNTMQ